MRFVTLAVITASDWIAAGITAVVAVLLAYLIRRYTKRSIRKKDTHQELIDVGGRVLAGVVLALGAFYTMRILEIDIGPTLGALGIGVLFVAVGLQPMLVNLVGSVILQARRPFRRGDQIRSAGFEGTVIDITSTSTVLLSYDGEAIHIPNSTILSNPLVNWTHEPVRRTVMPISVPYGCELPLVLSVLGRAARRLDDDKLPPGDALVDGFGADGININLRFWHYSDQLETQVAVSQVAVAVDEALREIGVTIPFPQLVVHSAPDPDPATDTDPGADGSTEL